MRIILLAILCAACVVASGVHLAGRYEKIEAEIPIEFVYQAPEKKPRGILLVLHGCSHSATDAWPKSEGCPSCLGLPIETTIVASALERGWVVVAVSSENQNHKCWGLSDVERLIAAREKVLEITKAPEKTAAVGASSGGSMAARLRFPGLVGCVAQIMPAPNAATTVPVRFVHMTRDVRRAAIIARQVAILKSRGLDAEELRVDPSPFTPETLWRREVPALGKVDAERLVAALERDGYLDENGTILEDPRASDWRKTAATIVPPDQDTLQPDKSPISELLNAHWAFHEFTDAHLSTWLDWLETL